MYHSTAEQNHTIIYTLRGVNFLQRQASYCGNLGMTRKAEKWQKLNSKIYARLRVHTPILCARKL